MLSSTLSPRLHKMNGQREVYWMHTDLLTHDRKSIENAIEFLMEAKGMFM